MEIVMNIAGRRAVKCVHVYVHNLHVVLLPLTRFCMMCILQFIYIAFAH